MIVECIDDNWHLAKGCITTQTLPSTIPKKGELYHVTDIVEIEGKDYYELFEIRKDWVWLTEKFREVDIDISQALVEDKMEVLV